MAVQDIIVPGFIGSNSIEYIVTRGLENPITPTVVVYRRQSDGSALDYRRSSASETTYTKQSASESSYRRQ